MKSDVGLRLQRRLIRVGHDQTGTSAVEFALLAPVLFMIIIAALYVSLYAGATMSLAQIAADVSRYAMTGSDQAQRRAMVQAWLIEAGDGYPLVNRDRMTVTVNEADDRLRISITYDISYLPLPEFVRDSVNLPSQIRLATATALT